MIDTRKRERIEFDIDQAFRDFAEGKRLLTKVCEDLVQVAMKQEVASEELIARKNEAESMIEYARTALEEAKSEYAALITNIKFYEF
jgi:uncharacterized protein YbcI